MFNAIQVSEIYSSRVILSREVTRLSKCITKYSVLLVHCW